MTVELGVTVAEVEDLIRSRIDASTLASGLIPGAVYGRRYVGRVAGGRFEVWIRRRSYNSLAPRLTGTIESTPGGSRVIANVGPPQMTRWSLAGLASFGAVGAIPVLLAVGYGPAVVLLLVAPLVIIVVLLLRGSVGDLGFPRSEAEELRQFLGEALGQRSV
jgi:hypothetical protein